MSKEKKIRKPSKQVIEKLIKYFKANNINIYSEKDFLKDEKE